MRVIELFCSSGGLAAGFRDAGVHVDLAFDFDADACASYEANLGMRPVRVDVRDVLRMGWAPRNVELIAADPPCAPWSRAGRRGGLNDERDMLAVTVDVITRVRPRAFLVGNIPGLEDLPNLAIVRRYLGGLARHGYCVDFAVLNAADFGVPQIRRRPFWFGHLNGPCIRWPARTHSDPAELRDHHLPGFDALRPWVTVREALACLPEEERGRPVRLRHEGARRSPRHPPNEPDAPANAITASNGSGSKRAVRVDDWLSPPSTAKRPPSTRGHQSERVGSPDEPAMTLDARPARVGTGDAGVFSWPWDRPSTTVCAETDKIGTAGRSGSHGESQGANAIVLSERAALLLQGLPATWVLAGKTKASRWSQLGQAVPPVVAAAIGRSVRHALEANAANAVRRTA